MCRSSGRADAAMVMMRVGSIQKRSTELCPGAAPETGTRIRRRTSSRPAAQERRSLVRIQAAVGLKPCVVALAGVSETDPQHAVRRAPRSQLMGVQAACPTASVKQPRCRGVCIVGRLCAHGLSAPPLLSVCDALPVSPVDRRDPLTDAFAPSERDRRLRGGSPAASGSCPRCWADAGRHDGKSPHRACPIAPPI